ncbi:TraX family protein [Pseudomonas aeruginosa]|nr:TraX family protein [Pseudomonas aeruginosa]MCS8482967.1 TraX family protein [Pseudomonas aeruginosa]MCV4039530.1 TraX family protein [Pseudomonas aeruginosa]MEB5091525.1 TraX family protein [Pseudomonas aeruginosa]MEB5097727.1 TraX family protein [Pseudomonas aeruginosa]MEB5109734.1 TraX family protein [Pseudomonas aeruginosa]
METSEPNIAAPSWGMSPPRLSIADGSIEALKWIALLLMTGDHVNKYLFNGTLPYLFEAGRLAMPVFVFVLAYNLARPGMAGQGAYKRTMFRLGLFGLLAMPAFVMLGSLMVGWFPLNIMFTLLVLTAVVALAERARAGSYIAGAGAVLVFLWGGGLVEFWWPAIALGLACWWYCKSPSWIALLAAVAACFSLTWINGNPWALAALLLVVGASRINLNVPRLRWVFYAYYPAHLVALLLIRIPMSKAGYLFF